MHVTYADDGSVLSLHSRCCTLQLANPGYRQFLEYMCPGYEKRVRFPPPGSDPSTCPHPILGVYDDHDFGWNNGDAR